ncbi:AP-4 complex accessory subunit tepsin [Tachyglossus aculeatus]|uniref:AP-4 complex accessory subunit tepsin n=1 Tax=Tachyglossus aculeatus TaxID=9261 RepID=UPI0018F4F6D2|nr:AP-4 complex accessory subunit tepsin [Tachyglossus aculeatus]
MAAPPLRDRLSFLQRLPALMKGTSDDDSPCPGYLLEEIAEISRESAGISQCLLGYLLNRLQSNSCHVKLKALKILLYLCSHSSAAFLLALRRNVSFIQEATAFGGPPDPLHGNSLYLKVRAAAQDLATTLFSDNLVPGPFRPPPPPGDFFVHPFHPSFILKLGMGSSAGTGSALQGFGYSRDRADAGSTSETLLSTFQKAAEVVTKALRPGLDHPGPRNCKLGQDTYQPVMAPTAGQGRPPPQKPSPAPNPQSLRGRHQPGQAGGGWEETDSGHSSQDSSQDNGQPSRASDSGSDGHSRTSREPGDAGEREETTSPLSDCLQEESLVSSVTRGPRVFLTREETQQFIKECGVLNCEAVLELLTWKLGDPSESVQMRALSAIFSVGCSDLLSQDQLFLITRPRLQQLSEAGPGPVANKATKILRHFEALCRSCPAAAARFPSESGRSPAPAAPLAAPPPPAAAETVLQPPGAVAPLGSSPPKPAPTAGDPRPDPSGGRQEADPAGRGPSLFAGMELVAGPAPTRGGHPPAGSAPGAPRTDPGPNAPHKSAFSFLNI